MRVHLFPFDKVEKGADVVICGLGTLGKEYIAEASALNWCNIKGIIDKNNSINEYQSIPVFTSDKYSLQMDCLFIVAVYYQEYALEIKKELIRKGVDKERIVWSDKICHITDCDADMIEPIEIRKQGVEKINEILINKGFYISGIPFYIQNFGKYEYVNDYKNFIRTNTVDNSLDQTRVFFLIANIESVLSRTFGAVAELGVYQGATAELLHQSCIKYDRTLFLFDTFDGFSEMDIVGVDKGYDPQAFSDTDEKSVRRRLGTKGHIKIKKGYFPESVDDETENASFAFVHIDCDLYKPIYAGLCFFWSRLVVGGMIVVHDYSSGFWDGATKAVDQFCEENNLNLVLIPDWSGTVAIIK